MGRCIAGKDAQGQPGNRERSCLGRGRNPVDVEFLNREAGAFLNSVTDSGKKLN